MSPQNSAVPSLEYKLHENKYLVCLVHLVPMKILPPLWPLFPLLRTLATLTPFWFLRCLLLLTQGLFLVLPVPMACKPPTLTLADAALISAQFICQFFSDFLITPSPDQEMYSF